MGTLCIDIGNTRCKLALYAGADLRDFRLVRSGDLLSAVGSMAESHDIGACIYSAVGSGGDALAQALDKLGCPAAALSAGLKGLPVSVDYATPQTLGSDRLAAAVGARTLLPGCDVLIADFGTCATFDLLTADGTFRGGNIAPGLKMRLAAMHRGTQALPAVGRSETPESSLLGTDTPTAMRRGAEWGLAFETEGYAARLRQTHSGLRLLLTGGQAEIVRGHLSPALRREAAIRPDLVLLGLRAAAEAAGLAPAAETANRNPNLRISRADSRTHTS